MSIALARLSLARHGAQLLPGLAEPLLDDLFALAARLPDGRAGTRIVGDDAAARLLASDGPIGQAVAELTGTRRFPVRAILFDKNDAANWALGWHQDRTIAVQERRDVPDYHRWTVKQGVLHVEPPFELIARMITVRIHLDPVDGRNAPLQIACGSHLQGLISDKSAAAVAAQCTVVACLAAVGDVWVYSTPILHASRAAVPGRRRRVLQVDYAADALPVGLDWLAL